MIQKSGEKFKLIVHKVKIEICRLHIKDEIEARFSQETRNYFQHSLYFRPAYGSSVCQLKHMFMESTGPYICVPPFLKKSYFTLSRRDPRIHCLTVEHLFSNRNAFFNRIKLCG